MPNQVIVLPNGSVGGENAAHGGIDHRHGLPLGLVSIVRIQPTLCHGIGAEVLQHKVGIRHGAVVPQQQAVVQILQYGRILREQGAVDHLGQCLTDLLVRLEDAHGVVGVLSVHVLHRVGAHAEDVDVLHAHLLGNLHIGAVHGAHGQCAVHHELHVAGAAGLLGGGGQLLGHFRGRHEDLGGGYIVVLQEHHLQILGCPGMLGNQVGQGVNEADDLLGTVVSGGCLGAEEEHPGLHFEGGIADQPVVQHQNVQGVEHLPLVLVETLGLGVEDEVRAYRNALAILHQLHQPLLVLPLYRSELFPEGGIVRKGTQLTEQLRLLHPLGADGVGNQLGQAGIAAHEPPAMGNAVGNGAELLRHYQVVVVEGFLLQDLAVKGADPVDGVAHGYAQVGHVHHAVGDDCHVADPIPLAGEVVPQPGAQPTVDLLQDLIHPGQQLLHHVLRPLFQCLGHDGVVGVGHGLLHNGGSLVPAQAFLVHEQAHHFGDGEAGMGVVDVDAHLLRQQAEVVAVELLKVTDDVLQGGAGEEVGLLQPQHLALVVVVFRIEHLGDHGGGLNGLHRLVVLALAEGLEVEALGAPGRPHAQGVHRLRVIAHNGHVVGHGFHRVVILVDKLGLAVLRGLFHVTAEVHLAGVLHHGHFPGIAVGQPAVRQLHLLAVHNLLAEQAVFVADGAAHGRQVQAGQAVQEAGGKPSQAAVAQAGFRLFLQQVGDVVAQFAEGLLVYVRGYKVQHVAIQAATHQKFNGKIVQPLGLGALPLRPGNGVLLHDLIPHGRGQCLVYLLGRSVLHAAAVVPLQLADDGRLNRLFIK